MVEEWGLEIIKGIGKLFVNPLLYWTILLLFISGHRRIKRERRQFGTKMYHLFSEIRHTLMISIVFSIIISLFTISFGIILTFEMIMVLIFITILLSIRGSFAFLSASYTIGITFLVLMLLPYIHIEALENYVNFQELSIVHFISLALLVGMFLLAEAFLIRSHKYKTTFPAVVLSERGIWLGQHEIKRLSFIPFFAFVPSNQLTGLAPFLPYFHYGDQSFSLVLIPFLIGFQFKVQGSLPNQDRKKLSLDTLLLSLIVLLCVFSSLHIPVLAFLSILIAIFGKEWITYRHRLLDKKKPAIFSPLNEGVKVLGTIPNSRAEQLEILVGETILRVNGHTVRNSSEFYEALQNSGAFFKLDIIDQHGELRFIRSAFYEEDHHELGIIFPEEPYYKKRPHLMSKVVVK